MRTPPPPSDDLRFSNTTGILQKKNYVVFFVVEVEQETSAPPPKKKSWIRPCYAGHTQQKLISRWGLGKHTLETNISSIVFTKDTKFQRIIS